MITDCNLMTVHPTAQSPRMASLRMFKISSLRSVLFWCLCLASRLLSQYHWIILDISGHHRLCDFQETCRFKCVLFVFQTRIQTHCGHSSSISEGFRLTFIAVGGFLILLTRRSMIENRAHAWPHFLKCCFDHLRFNLARLGNRGVSNGLGKRSLLK